MSIAPFALIAGFGKNTGAAIIRRFERVNSHSLWDLTNDYASNHPIRVPVKYLLDQIDVHAPLKELRRIRNGVFSSYAARHMSLVSHLELQDIPPVNLFIYNTGKVDYDTKLRLQQYTTISLGCDVMVEAFGSGTVPSAAEHFLKELRFLKSPVVSRFLLLTPSHTHPLRLDTYTEVHDPDLLHCIYAGVTTRLRNSDIEVQASQFTSSNMQEWGDEARNPEEFADNLFRQYHGE